MNCERCNTEMDKKSVSIQLGYGPEQKQNGSSVFQEPIIVRSIYICPKCGKIELNSQK